MYTIIYERDGNEHAIPMVFGEKQLAMDHACEFAEDGIPSHQSSGSGIQHRSGGTP